MVVKASLFSALLEGRTYFTVLGRTVLLRGEIRKLNISCISRKFSVKHSCCERHSQRDYPHGGNVMWIKPVARYVLVFYFLWLLWVMGVNGVHLGFRGTHLGTIRKPSCCSVEKMTDVRLERDPAPCLPPSPLPSCSASHCTSCTPERGTLPYSCQHAMTKTYML